MQRTSFGLALAGRDYVSARQGQSVSTIAERDHYDCNACRYQFSVTSGTIFHDSHLPLCDVYSPLMILWENGFTVPYMKAPPLLIWSIEVT
jgi:transposase-like protein